MNYYDILSSHFDKYGYRMNNEPKTKDEKKSLAKLRFELNELAIKRNEDQLKELIQKKSELEEKLTEKTKVKLTKNLAIKIIEKLLEVEREIIGVKGGLSHFAMQRDYLKKDMEK